MPSMKAAQPEKGFKTISGRPVDQVYTPGSIRSLDTSGTLLIPEVSLHARHPRHRLPGQALDDAAVCRVRDAGGDQRALQAAAGGRRHRPERRLRPADADGTRSRPRAVRRRSGQVRRQRRVARRHGGAVQRDRSRRDHHVDDDQLAGVDDLRDVSRRCRTAGRGMGDAVGHHAERHPEGVHRPEGVHLSAPAVDAADHRCLRVLRDGSAAGGTPSR